MSADVTLYTRRDCGLCDETARALYFLRDELGFALQERDIDEDPGLREQYNDIVPVVALGERVIAHAPVDGAELRRSLLAAFGR